MGCFSCFKPSSRHDSSEQDPIKTAIEISRYEEEDRTVRQKIEEEEQIKRAMEKSLEVAEQKEESKEKGKRKQVEDDDDQVGDKAQIKNSKDRDVNPSPSICNGCKSAIKDGISANAFGAVWHPQCLCCLHCLKPIAMHEISNSKGQFHKPCYKEHRNRNCYVCDNKIPITEKGREYKEHPFWKEKYCPCHEFDGTAKCCSCERLESCGTKYVMLADERWLCRQCMECAVMDTDECQPLHIEVQQMVTSVTKGPRMGPNKQLIIDTVTESHRVSRKCEVTAILILYGLPRFLTGYILAHEMMHAWLRLNGYRNLNMVLEEGLCQMLGHMWLEPQIYATPDAADPSSASSSSSSRTPLAATTSKKLGDQSDFEKRLVEFCKHQIETDESPVYGDGFRKVKKMMLSNHDSLKDTLKDIVTASKSAPPGSKF
ncbi:unnamed protein product [Thlaspi arvense]|uniref:LIM zinc-binding domain-containing protein n=1 Tax=Thlaspi arvense TaxID=13288 RepID=A0AAU9RI82_THLAR|nr:unnamed protein product [Thlaspi arvense]